ncbi:MAG: GreA/GreB family elongation factor [Trichlorobacter sp.]
MSKTNLITAAGMKRLEQEFDQLWRVERPKVVRGVTDAAAEGDRSENAEYIYGKKRLREIDRQLKHLGTRLKLVKVAALPANPRQVSFGCWVSYEDQEGTERCYQLVGPDEFDVGEGKISIDSPVGQALLLKKVDDEVLIRKPSGVMTVTITAIGNTKPE